MNTFSGYPFYGQKIAILVFSTTTPRIAGDPGNNDSFDFPVRYKVIEGGYADLLSPSQDVKERLLKAVGDLKKRGITAVVGDCGLMSLYQDEIGKLGITFIGSSLCMVPALWQMIGKSGKIGILTGHSDFLKREHLVHSGVDETIDVFVQGMQEEQHFKEIVIEGGHHLDPFKMKEDVLNATKKMMQKCADIRAIVLECSNLGTYSSFLAEEFQLPVVDIVNTCVFLKNIIDPKKYI